MSAVAGLVSTTDIFDQNASYAAEKLGLHGTPVPTKDFLRDKVAVRRRLFEHGLSAGTGTAIDPDTAAADVDFAFPLMVKDTAGSASRYVWRARNRDELARALAEAGRSDLRGGLFVEPYFNGPLYSLESLTFQGETRLLGVSARVLSPEPLFREEALTFPVRFDRDVVTAVGDRLARVLEAVGHENGFAHTEVILSDTGDFEVVEINARLGGSQIGEGMCRAYEVNVYEAFVDLALGSRPRLMDVPLKARRGFAQVLIYAPAAGVLAAIEGAESYEGHPGEPRLHPVRFPGDAIHSIESQDGNVALVTAEGPTSETALLTVLSAANRIQVTVEEPA